MGFTSLLTCVSTLVPPEDQDERQGGVREIEDWMGRHKKKGGNGFDDAQDNANKLLICISESFETRVEPQISGRFAVSTCLFTVYQ